MVGGLFRLDMNLGGPGLMGGVSIIMGGPPIFRPEKKLCVIHPQYLETQHNALCISDMKTHANMIEVDQGKAGCLSLSYTLLSVCLRDIS